MSAPCNYLRRLAGHHAITAAFLQTLEEFGIPEHPDGECPADDCNCTDPAVVARFLQIVEAAIPARNAGTS